MKTQGGIYGSYKIAQELKKHEHLATACRNTVAFAMREMQLKSRVSKKFKPVTTESDLSKKPSRNILAQDFTSESPNEKWIADITYLPTAAGWVYLAVALDLFSRKVVGWAISEGLATPVVTETFRKAIESRQPERGTLLHHSDRRKIHGTHFTQDCLLEKQ